VKEYKFNQTQRFVQGNINFPRCSYTIQPTNKISKSHGNVSATKVSFLCLQSSIFSATIFQSIEMVTNQPTKQTTIFTEHPQDPSTPISGVLFRLQHQVLLQVSISLTASQQTNSPNHSSHPTVDPGDVPTTLSSVVSLCILLQPNLYWRMVVTDLILSAHTQPQKTSFCS